MNRYVIAFVALLATTFGASAMAWGGRHGGDYHYGGGGYYHGDHWGSHSHFGFYIGMPLIWPRVDYYRGYSGYTPYPVTQVVVERQPQIYVQRETTANNTTAPGYWYYCPDSRTYYPYAQTCPSAWLQVVPQTTPQVPR